MDRISFLSCFFPAFNEEDNIGPLLEEALGTLPRFAERFEVIVVDDGSTDGTADTVRAYAEKHPEVRIESHPRNLGYGHAIRTGLRESRGDVVFFTDSDRQFRLDDIRLLLASLPGADLVAGYRIKRSDPWHRLVAARVYRLALRTVLGARIRDADCAFKLIRRSVLDAVLDQLRSQTEFFSAEFLIRSMPEGFRVVQVGVPHHPRTAGTNRGASPEKIARTAREMFAMRPELR